MRLRRVARDDAQKEDKETGSTYVAWRHILPYGGTEYLSKTTFQNCTPEELCDFFNSDQTRKAWDPLLIKSEIIERDVNTGADLVYWERKLPVISNRDYVFSRRTWTEKQKSPANPMLDDLTRLTTPMKGSGMRTTDFLLVFNKNNKNVYYSITKGMTHPNVPKSKKFCAWIRTTRLGKLKPCLISKTRTKCVVLSHSARHDVRSFILKSSTCNTTSRDSR